MKTIIFSISLFLIVNFSFSQEQKNGLRSTFDLVNGKRKPVPQIFNNVNISEFISKGYENNFNATDSFPLFPGFPVEVQGETRPGGIYCQMDSDSDLEIVYAVGQIIYAWNIDGTNVPGWPINLFQNAGGSPSFGDIDGDGVGEIVIGAYDYLNSTGAIYAFEINGTPVTGFPINHGFLMGTVVLGDLDNDNVFEVITNKATSTNAQIWVYKGNGTIYPGWPRDLISYQMTSSAVGDITGDGIPEIVSPTTDGIFAYDRNGNILPGFPYILQNNEYIYFSSPVLADINNDNTREIIFGTGINNTDGYVYVLKNNGTVFPGWPKHTTGYVTAPVLAVDLNDNNIMDIIVGDVSPSSYSHLYGWDKNGNNLPGFPINLIDGVNIQPAAGDIDNDNQLEIIVDDDATISGIGRLSAFNSNGTPVAGWPLYFQGSSFSNFPSLADLNHDNILDIVSACMIGFPGNVTTKVYVWNTGMIYNPSKIINPMWQFNSRHSGVYGDNNLTGVVSSNYEIPNKFKLEQNYPNPFNPTTRINYELPVTNYVTLKIYDIVGKEVATLVNEKQNAGRYSVQFDGSRLSSGTYFYKIVAGDFVHVKRMILIK